MASAIRETEPGPVVFVRFQEEHLPEVMEIELEAYPEPWSEGMLRQEMRSPQSYFYVLYVGDDLAGYGGFWRVANEAHITSVTVKCEFRGQGLGRRLVEYLLSIAIKLGLDVATLEVRESNGRARGLYESMGFEQVGIRKKYYSKTQEDAIVMLKDLDAPEGQDE